MKYAFPRDGSTLGGAIEIELDRVVCLFPKEWRAFKDNTGDFERQGEFSSIIPVCWLSGPCLGEI